MIQQQQKFMNPVDNNKFYESLGYGNSHMSIY